MRKLTYDVFTKKGVFVNNVNSYNLAIEAKEKGYTVKEKFEDVRENKPKKIKKNF